MGGASPIDRDQHVLPVRDRDLPERCLQHQQMIRAGERTGVARAQHHRQRVPDIAAPRGQRMKAPALLVGPGRLLLVTGRVDQRRVDPDHQHRRRRRRGGGGRRGRGCGCGCGVAPQVTSGHPDRRELPVPGLDRRPRPRPGPQRRPGQPSSWQPVVVEPHRELVQRAQHRGVRAPTSRTEQLHLRGHRLDVGQARRPGRQRARPVHQRPTAMPDRHEVRPGQHLRQVLGQPQPVRQQPRQRHPGLRDRPGPTNSHAQPVRPPERGVFRPDGLPDTVHPEGAPSCGCCEP